MRREITLGLHTDHFVIRCNPNVNLACPDVPTPFDFNVL